MRILLVDDDKLVCMSLCTILSSIEGMEVVGQGYDGEEAVSLYRQLLPDVLLMDIRMNNMNGLEAAGKILEEFPQGKILFLTTFSDDEYIISALRMGAKGYILKENFEGLEFALKAVHQGKSVYGEEIVTKLPDLLAGQRKDIWDGLPLIEREKEVIVLVAEGLSNKEIANKLFLSEGTVRNYISVILEKLHLRDRTQLAIFYLTVI